MDTRNLVTGIAVTLLVLILIVGGMVGCPKYNVYRQEMQGLARFKEAEQDRKILIEEAQAQLIADSLNARGEVVRARGMAEAMDIESGKLTPIYNQYLFIRSLEDLADKGDLPTLMYIPTEGMLPVMDIKQHK